MKRLLMALLLISASLVHAKATHQKISYTDSTGKQQQVHVVVGANKQEVASKVQAQNVVPEYPKYFSCPPPAECEGVIWPEEPGEESGFGSEGSEEGTAPTSAPTLEGASIAIKQQPNPYGLLLPPTIVGEREFGGSGAEPTSHPEGYMSLPKNLGLAANKN